MKVNFLAILSDSSSAYKVGETIGMIIGVLLLLAIPAAFIICLVQFIRTKKRGWLIGLICSVIPGVLFLGLVAFGAIKGIQSAADKAKEMAIAEGGLISPEGDGFSLTAPDHWKFIKDLHEEAGLQIGNERREEYLIVISELKEDFTGDLKEYGEITSGGVADSLLNANASEAKEVSLDGLTGIQQRISGGIENINVSYLHTVLETDTRYHQIIGWTLKSKESVAIPLFEKVLKSLKQTPETEL